MFSTNFIVLVCVTISAFISVEALIEPIQCEQYNESNCTGTYESCKHIHTCVEVDSDKASNCFVLWKEDNRTGEVKVTMKGCFTDNQNCNQSQCIDTSPEPKSRHNFCCCTGSLCNLEHKWVPQATLAPEIKTPAKERSNETLVVLLVSLSVFTICLSIATLFYFRYKQRQAAFDEVPTRDPDPHGPDSYLPLNEIALIEKKASGRFGTVWKAQMKPEEVAVKIFPPQDRQSWLTEREVYSLPRMKHPNILQFIGAEKRAANPPEFWLITAYHSNGSLCDYLKSHTVSWMELCRIAESMARGLMHLHEEIGGTGTRSESIKPAIAHRDFKSKNVLLKDDLTACIADFGLALAFKPSEACGDSHGQVGTRRYMAPEILEGAINFTRDAFLRIDVYACGLVLWELVSRCTAHGGQVSDYTLPFEIELGPHPSLEEMQENVVTKKLRPRIMEHWRNHTGLSAICDTMEECWDHDAEARLSSSCVMERVSQHIKYPATTLLIETNTNTPLIKENSDSM